MKFVKYLLIIIWMILIFYFSNQPANNSSKQSKGIIIKGITTVTKIVNKNISNQELNKIIYIVEKPVRKAAHIFLYFVLAILVTWLLKSYNLTYNQIFLYSILICVLYSCSDEIHQLFISGRSGSIVDVFIDNLGSYLGIFIINKRLKLPTYKL